MGFKLDPREIGWAPYVMIGGGFGLGMLVLAVAIFLMHASPHISQVSRCAGWVRAGGWFRTRVLAAVGGWAGLTMVSLVAGLVESRSQAAAALRNRA